VPKDEIERRRKVVAEKILGAIIEYMERYRMSPLARSIGFRLFFLHQSIDEFLQVVRAMGLKVDPTKTIAPPFTIEQTNVLIKTYNSIIQDIQSHFAKKNSYVKSFSLLKELDEATIDEVDKTLFVMGVHLSQILSYLIRWVE